MNRRISLALRSVSLLAFVLLLAGCASSRLHKDDFEGRRIAAQAAFPPAPLVHNQYLTAAGVYPYNPVGRPATGRARTEEDQVKRLQGLLNAATERIDLAGHVALETLIAGADQLGARITNDLEEADYVLDLRVYHYGLLMRSYHSEANFYFEAELLMRDRATGEVIWQRKLNRVGTYKTRLTGAEMAHLTEEGMAQELEKFAAFAADRMAGALTSTIKKG